MDIKGHVFMVTGGATGLGRGAAKVLVEHGAKVAIIDTNSKKGKQLAEELGENALFLKTDVTSEKDSLESLEKTADYFGGFHGLVNAAGIGVAEKILNKKSVHSLDHFKKVIEVNLVGTFNMMRLAADKLRYNEPNEDKERGVIINTASIAGLEGRVGQVAYSASKSGVAGMTLPAAREMARYGVRVMTIAPGVFETILYDPLPKEALERLGEKVPFPNRIGKSTEYGSLVQHIISNPMLNGEIIRIDGAMRL
ncbi:NAD(P)-dependent dehydrogenase (short-subunit alcohol dehydrogenase family) [Sinobaca qinghaiensis]|uniref:NAD(P)-dependent dehydrogenase (Short-subunit alcohol dehydrogenase family) n=1 Tax=Sinobaca qinghaiensis TaxID=342944 RepID=A0A419UZJ3_9BACL|nr:SDR family NAD(P)-dependent oxidoreductase [Sinobaca qinghaiensis]RKD71103.1 NAD(P)-dependent dehydrogenase (short-subunit alcohol dehydrogenase family) [Sinobaca qinghaiensis]